MCEGVADKRDGVVSTVENGSEEKRGIETR
jgi:hypothetical protein